MDVPQFIAPPAAPAAEERATQSAMSASEGADFAPIHSQGEFDRAIGHRLATERAKFADYDDLKAKAAAFDAAEDEKATEIEKATKARQKAESDAQAAQSALLRYQVAATKGVPAELLAGTSQAELEAAADALVEFAAQQSAGTPRAPKPDATQGRNGNANGDAPSGDWLREGLLGA